MIRTLLLLAASAALANATIVFSTFSPTSPEYNTGLAPILDTSS